MITGIDLFRVFVILFNSTNVELAAILETTTTKKAGIYQYVTCERYIRKIRHSGPGCSDMDSTSVLVLFNI